MSKYDYQNFSDIIKDVNKRVLKKHTIDEFIRVTKTSLICKYVKM